MGYPSPKPGLDGWRVPRVPPIPGLGRGVTCPRSVGYPVPGLGEGYPIPGQGGGVSIPGLGGGTPSQVWMAWELPGVPRPGLDGGGYPIPGLDGGGSPQPGLDGWGVPRVPPHQDWMG